MRLNWRALAAIAVVALVGAAIVAASIALLPPRRKDGYSAQVFPIEPFTMNDLIRGAGRRVNENPRNWRARREYAQMLLGDERFAAAETHLRYVIENAPDLADVASAHRLMGVSQLQQRQYEQAVNEFSTALAVLECADPPDPEECAEILEWRASAEFYAGRYHAALGDCDESDKLGNRRPQLARIWAMCLVKTHEWEQALEVLEGTPNDVGNLMLRAYALAGLGRQTESSAAMARARALDPARAARWDNFVESPGTSQ